MTDKEIAVFDHPKNITVGRARVIFTPHTIQVGSTIYPAGWVLPGGGRTTDEGHARQVAATLDHQHDRLP